MNRRSAPLAGFSRIFLLFAALLAGGLPLSAQRDALSGRDIPGMFVPQPANPEPKEPLPPAPAGMILDPAKVLQPEAVARLGAKLAAARDQQVFVYVVTIPSLGVPASKRLEKFDALIKEYAETWLPRSIGAVVLFDDESGLMTVLMSPETDRRFATFAMELELKGPISKAQESGLAREKLERSAELVVQVLCKHQAEAIRTTRRNRIGNTLMAIVAVVGIGLVVISALGSPRPVEQKQ